MSTLRVYRNIPLTFLLTRRGCVDELGLSLLLLLDFFDFLLASGRGGSLGHFGCRLGLFFQSLCLFLRCADTISRDRTGFRCTNLSFWSWDRAGRCQRLGPRVRQGAPGERMPGVLMKPSFEDLEDDENFLSRSRKGNDFWPASNQIRFLT